MPRDGGEVLVMKYMTVKDAARRWNVTERLVQRLCAEGRIDGAVKFGRSWSIPVSARKPDDPRRADSAPQAVMPRPRRVPGSHANLMPLMNTPFAPGTCAEFVDSLAPGPAPRYRAGRALLLQRQAGKRPSPRRRATLRARISTRAFQPASSAHMRTCRLGASTERSMRSRRRAAPSRRRRKGPQLRAAEAFIAQTASVLLHLPAPEGLPRAQDVLPLLPPGLRAFACYVQAHAIYLAGDYAQSFGIAQTALMTQEDVYPIPSIYLHLIAVIGPSSGALRETDRAREHLRAAWELARPNDLIQAFGEHRQGCSAACSRRSSRPRWPEDFKRIIAITYRCSRWLAARPQSRDRRRRDRRPRHHGVRRVHACRARLDRRGRLRGIWAYSVNTVKSYISRSLTKLGVKRRQDLGRFMLS